jgi:acyl-CoA thioester hydrolase
MPDPTPRPHAIVRADYRRFLSIPTRWMDNDSYGHVNNVTYYSYFDTVVNEHLIRVGGLDIERDPVVGYVVETSCRYRKPLTFPETVDAGLRVARLGTSSATYEIGIFRRGDDDAAATGRFVHVWVDRSTQRPAPIPPRIRSALEPFFVGGDG